MRLRYTLLIFTLISMLLSTSAYAVDDPQIYSFAITPPGNQLSVIGKKGRFVLIHNKTSERRLISIHKSYANLKAVALSSDSQWVALGTPDGSVLLYKTSDLWRGKTRSNLIVSGHDNTITAVAFSPDGKTLASGATDGSLQLKPFSSSSVWRQLLIDKSRSAVKVIAFTPDGQTLAAGRSDGTISLWNVERFSSWNVEQREANKHYEAHNREVTALAFSPNGKTLASGAANSEFRLWNVSSHTELTSLKGHDGKVGAINTLAFSSDGKILASGAADKKALLWNTETLEKISEYSLQSSALSIVFATGDQQLLVGDKAGKLTRLAAADFRARPHSENQVQAALYQEIPRPKNLAPIYSVAFAPSTDKPTYILGQANHFLLTTDQHTHHKIKHPRYYIGSLTVCAAFSPSLKYALGLSKGNLVLLYDSLDDQNWSSFSTDSTVNTVTFSPDSKIIAVGTEENVSFWNAQTKGKYIKQPKSIGTTHTLAFSPDGKILAIGKTLGTVELWDVNKNKNLMFLRPEVPSAYGIYALAFSPDGKTLAAGGEHNGEISLWRIPSAKRLGLLKGHQATTTIHSVAFSPNNETLASGATDGRVLLWNVQAQTKIDPIQHFSQKHPKFSGTGHKENTEVLSVTFADDGKTLMSGDATGLVLRWDLSKIDIDTTPRTDRFDRTDLVFEETLPDPAPPTIVLGAIPTVKAETQGITIQGSITSNIGIQDNRIRLNNNGKALPSVTPTANGGFAAAISLNEGNNNITFIAVDTNQQRTEKVVTLYRPLMPPEIEILEPRLDRNNAADIRQPTQRIRVRVTDASDITRVTLNDTEMVPTQTTNVYALTSPPIVSRTNFTTSAADIHGSQNSKVFTLNYKKPDDIPPTITILQPVRDASNVVTITTSPLLVTVEVTDESGITDVRINGIQATDLGNNTFRRSVPYTTSLNRVEITATDTVGNANSKSFGVVYGQTEDNFPPDSPMERDDPRLLFADSKLENTRRKISNNAVFTLEFIVLDDSPIKEAIVKCTDDGTTYQVSKLGKRDYTAQLQLKEGDNRFEIRVTDAWNNIEVETITLTRIQADTEAPRFASLSVGEGIQVQQIPVRGGYLAYNDPIVVTNEKLILRGRLTDESGIANVKVAVNNSTLEELPLRDGTQFEKSLSLDYGQNQIHITATDIQGNADDTSFTIHQRPDRDGKDLALLFATNQYDGAKDSRGHWKNLTTAIADAEKVAKKLRANYGFKTKIVKNPTGRELMDTLIAYQDKFTDENSARFSYEAGSQLLIYFAGHGYYNDKTEAGYLVARESEPPALDPSQFTAIEHSNLRRNIDLIKCNRVLVLMDTCFSGTFDPKYKPQTSAQLRSLVEDGPLLEQINMMLKLTARWCLTSASGEYVADTGGRNGHSPFAAAFMAALDTNGGSDNLLKLDEIWQQIQESRNASIYDTLEQNPERAGLPAFERPEPRKGQFGAKAELYQESDFLLFPTGPKP